MSESDDGLFLDFFDVQEDDFAPTRPVSFDDELLTYSDLEIQVFELTRSGLNDCRIEKKTKDSNYSENFHVVPRLVGTWNPIPEKSESYEKILHAMGVGWFACKLASRLSISSTLYYQADSFCVLGSSALGDSIDRYDISGVSKKKLVNEPAGTPCVKDVWQCYVINIPNEYRGCAVATVTISDDPNLPDKGVLVAVITIRRLTCSVDGVSLDNDTMHEHIILKKFKKNEMYQSPPSLNTCVCWDKENLTVADCKIEGAVLETTEEINRYLRRDSTASRKPMPLSLLNQHNLSISSLRKETVGKTGEYSSGEKELLLSLSRGIFTFLGGCKNGSETCEVGVRSSAFVTVWHLLTRGAGDSEIPLSRAQLFETLRLFYNVWNSSGWEESYDKTTKLPNGKHIYLQKFNSLDGSLPTNEVRRLSLALLRLRQCDGFFSNEKEKVCMRENEKKIVVIDENDGETHHELTLSLAAYVASKIIDLGIACKNVIKFNDFVRLVENDEILLACFHIKIDYIPPLEALSRVSLKMAPEVDSVCCGIFCKN